MPIFQNSKYLLDDTANEMAFLQKLEKVECNVVAKMFCEERKSPLLIGSVKSHTGHTEATAGFMSVLKALLALDTGYIAPNMHFSEPNPILKPLVENKLKVNLLVLEREFPSRHVWHLFFFLLKMRLCGSEAKTLSILPKIPNSSTSNTLASKKVPKIDTNS